MLSGSNSPSLSIASASSLLLAVKVSVFEHDGVRKIIKTPEEYGVSI